MPNRPKGLLVIFLVAIITVLFGLSALGSALEKRVGLPWLFKVRGPIEPPSEIVLVGINGQTGQDLGLPRLPRDWPRTIHGQLIDKLVALGASVIVFDIHFLEPKRPQDDEQFAASVASAKRVLLFEKLNGQRKPITDQTGANIGWAWVEEVVPPFELLASAARGLGPFPLPKIAADVQEFWVFKESAGDVPTLPAVALQLYAIQEYPEEAGAIFAKADGESARAMADGEAAFEDLRILMLNLRRALQGGAPSEPAVERQNRLLDPEEGRDIVRSLARLYKGDANRFLNFYGPPGTITYLPYQSVIKGADPNLPREAMDLNGKVAFIGYSDLNDPGQPDRFYTVYTRDDGVDLSGVEIMASAFGNLLEDSALKPTGLTNTSILLLAFGLAIGAIAYLLPAVVGIPLALLIVVSYGTWAQFLFSNDSVLIPLATPVLVQFPLALFVGLLGQYYIERRRSERMSEAIGHYLPQDVVENLTGSNPDPSKINKVVYSTCLATDMAGFSTMAEKMDPGQLAGLLNDYFDSLAKPLKDNQVDVTEFRADAIMCAWTAETPDMDVRRKALLASLQAADAFAQFKQRNPVYEGVLRIGLEAGMVHVGHSGGGGKFVYSIVGDTANTASRVEGLNKHIGTQVLATEAVVEGIDILLLRDVGEFQFVGKSEAQRIFEVLSLLQNATPDQLSLCNSFGEAMSSYRQAEWQRAQKLFESILKTFPNDGPAQFYWQQCQHYLDGEPVPTDPGIIRMSKK